MLKTDRLVDAVASRQFMDAVYSVVNNNRPFTIPDILRSDMYELESVVKRLRSKATELERYEETRLNDILNGINDGN